MIVPRGGVAKGVEAGDIVLFRGKSRLVATVWKYGIAFVRVGPSQYWDGDKAQNATAYYDLPLDMEVIRQADDQTRLLAQRFRDWHVLQVPQRAWDLVCALGAAAIRCTCSDS